MNSNKAYIHGKDYHLLNPLRMQPVSSREAIYSNPCVNSVLRLKENILTKDFLKLKNTVLQFDEAQQYLINNLVESTDRMLSTTRKFWPNFERVFPDILFGESITYLDLLSKEPDSGFSPGNEMDKAATEHAKNCVNIVLDQNVKSLEGIRTQCDNIEKEIGSFATRHSVQSLDILKPDVLYYCKHCKRFISLSKCESRECSLCRVLSSIDNSDTMAIKKIHSEVLTFLRNDIWFEEGVAYWCRRFDYLVNTGKYIQGGSGVFHEIDILAEKPKDGVRFCCECKTGRLRSNDILIFAGKLRDCGISRGIMVSVKEINDRNLELLGLNHGIKIYGNTLDFSQAQWESIFDAVPQ